MKPSIHQFTAGFTQGDAISNEAAALRSIFRRWGHESEIFSDPAHISPAMRSTARPAAEYASAPRAEDVAILHLSIGSRVTDIFASLPCRKVILYHNITPPRYFERINPATAARLREGLASARALAGTAELTLADSAFNARELENMGHRGVRVLPLVFDLSVQRAQPDKRILRELRDGLVNILFVGRGVPNKKIEDAVRAFAVFQRLVEPRSRFIHAGSYAGAEIYRHIVLSDAREMRARNVVLAGTVSQPVLTAFYAAAHVFLCMSEHEGFGIPIIESMMHGVPVLAYAAAAVPETMDGAGVLVREKRWPEIAEMIGELARPGPFREAVLRAQKARVERYFARPVEKELFELFSPLLGEQHGTPDSRNG